MKDNTKNNAGFHVQVADYLIELNNKGANINANTDISKFDNIPYAATATTVFEYNHIIDRLQQMKNGAISRLLSKPATAGEYYKNRAAVKRAITYAFLEGDYEWMRELITGYKYHDKPQPFLRRDSKRSDNRTLVPDWRELYLARLSKSKSKYKTHALLCYLTGMRPHEFTSELGATIYFDGSTITVKIKGAKIKMDKQGNQVAGVTERSMVFDANSEELAIKMLLGLKDPCEFKLKVNFGGPKSEAANELGHKALVNYEASMKNSLASAIGTFGKGLLGVHRQGANKGKVKPFTAYNLRHAFASALRAANVDMADISRALGHMSERTQSYYGRKNAPHSGGAVIPSKFVSSEIPRKVKPSTFGKTTGAATGVPPAQGATTVNNRTQRAGM